MCSTKEELTACKKCEYSKWSEFHGLNGGCVGHGKTEFDNKKGVTFIPTRSSCEINTDGDCEFFKRKPSLKERLILWWIRR